MAKITYLEKLKDPRWQKLRLEILDRDNWTCQICGATDKTLHAHHVHYERLITNPWEYDNDQIITLCEDCHLEEHESIQDSKDYLITTSIRAGFNTAEKLSKLAELIDLMHLSGCSNNPSDDKEVFIREIQAYWDRK